MKTRLYRLIVSILIAGLGWPLIAQSAPVLETSTTSDGASSAITLPRPAGTQEGDLLVAALMLDRGDRIEVSPPSGWTLIRRSDYSRFVGMATYYKVAGSAEPSGYTFALDELAKWAAGISRISGADTAAPIHATSINSDRSGSVTAASVSTTEPDTLVLGFYTNRRNATYTPDPTTTEQYDEPNMAEGLPSNMLAVFHQPATGPTGDKTAIPSRSDRQWAAQQVVIAPERQPIDLSSFILLANSEGTAGNPFVLSVTDAKNSSGYLLNGTVSVMVASSVDGLLLADDISMVNGIASIPITLLTAAGHTLSVAIEGITTPQSVSVDIGPQPVTVTADSGQSKRLNDPDPALTYTITSGRLIPNTPLVGQLTREPGETAGLYSILQGSLTDAANPNYTIAFVSADFEILDTEPPPPAEQTPPALEASVTAVGSGTAIALAKPEGTAVGDLLIASFMLDRGSRIEMLIGEDEWTLICRCNSSRYLGMATYYRIAGSSEPGSYSFPLDESTKWAAGISRISGVNTNDPVHASSSSTGQSGNTTASSVATTEPNTLVMSFFSNRRNATFTPDASTVEQYDEPNLAEGLPSNMMATFDQVEMGDTGNKTAIPERADRPWAAQQVVINPEEAVTEPSDLSGFSVQAATEGNSIAGESFMLNITGATDTNGDLLSGSLSINVSNSSEGLLVDDVIVLASGAAEVPITLITVGKHTLLVTLAGMQSSESLTVTVDPRPITLTADSGQSKVEGEADPLLTYTLTDGTLLREIPLTGALSRDSGETAGLYPIRQGSLTDANNPSYAISFVSADFEITEATVTPPPTVPTAGIWTSAEELSLLPMSGTAWENLKSRADQSLGTPNLSDQEDTVNVYTMAKALVYARTGIASYRDEVIKACMQAINTEDGGRTLALGRNLGAYVIAADLVGLPAEEDALFRDWLRDTLTDTNMTEGRYLIWTHENRPNNWGTHAGEARTAVAAYLGDEKELERCAQVFKGWLGDRSSYAGFSYGDLWWQSDPSRPVGINPKGATIEGHNVDGVLPDDQRRGGSFTWPPPAENYVYEALQGALLQAVILHRAGYDVWNWEDQALLRAFTWLHEVVNYPAEGDDTWQPYIINYYYGTSFPTVNPSRPGKNIGWTCWTHGETPALPSQEVAAIDSIALATASEKVAGDMFSLNLSGARDAEGTLFTGAAAAAVASSLEDLVFDGYAFFSDGNAVISISLLQPSVHTLSVGVQGTISESLSVTILPRPVTVTADSGQGKIEGEADPALTYTLTDGTLLSGIPLTGALNRDSGETAGFYPIRQGSLTDANNPNYDITFMSADFEITEATVTLPPPSSTVGIWTSAEELSLLPMKGAAWDNLKSKADRTLGYPNLSDQEDTVNVYTMAKALVYARTGIESYRNDVIKACIQAINTEDGGRTLALGRNLGAFVIAADLVGLPAEEDALFRDWLRDTLTDTNMTEGRYLIWTHENRPNNWGTHAGGARAAVAAYLGDEKELERCAQVFKGWLGDRSSYAGFSYGDLWWQSDPSRPVGINPKGATIKGYNVDGVLPDDQRRGGSFTWPPPAENYVYEALQGALLQAVILHRAGYDVWNWADQALLRSFTWLHEVVNYPAEGDDTWQPYIINYYYGTSFPTVIPSQPGKNVGWTCWTHQ